MRRLIVLLLMCFVVGSLAFAQESATTGSITGTVVDNNGDPLPGATVTATSDTGVKRSAVTDVDGSFSIPFLAPGKYTVEVVLQGFTPYKAELSVSLGQRVNLGTITLQLAGKAEVVVTETPTVDVVSTTTGATISEELMKNVPVGRNFAAVTYISPNVVGSGVGAANPSIAGASGLENTYIVDGVNITNTGYGSLGAYSIVFGSLGTGINFDYVKEVQVKSGGFEAEFGEALGGVVNVITKSGGNVFSGDVFGYVSPGFLEAERKHRETTLSPEVFTTETQDFEGGFDAGGKIIQDKLFWFAAFNPQWIQTSRIAPEGLPLSSFGEVRATRRIFSYSGKLTLNASANHIFEVSAFGDPGTSDRTLWRDSSFLGDDFDNGSETLKYGGNNQVARWTGVLSDNLLIEAQVAHHDDHFFEEDVNPVERILERPSLRVFGGLGFFGQDESDNLQFSGKLTYVIPNLAGRHELKVGAQYQDVGYDHTTDYSGMPRCFDLPDGTGFCTVTGNTVRITRNWRGSGLDRWDIIRNRVGENTVSTDTKYFNWFVQDNWSILPNLTLKLGVRWERQELSGGGQGAASLTLSNNWAPRVGFVWDFMNDRKGKIYGYYGQFYEKIPNDLAVRSLSVESDMFVLALTGPGLPPEAWLDVFNDPTNIAFWLDIGGEPATFCSTHIESQFQDPNTLPPECLGKDLKAQYSWELVFGFERQIYRDIVVGARYQHREIGRVIEDLQLNRYSDIFINGTADFGNYVITNVDSTYPGFPDPTRDYDAIEVFVNKRFGNNWQLFASYRYARLNGNYEGLFNNDNGQSDPNITSKFDFPCVRSFDPALGFTCENGPLPTERHSVFRAFGSYAFDFGLNLGLGVNIESGTPLTGYGCLDLYGCHERLVTPRGGLGRTPTIWTVDLHLDYTLRFSSGQRLTLLADIFNLFNQRKATAFDTLEEFNFGSFELGLNENTDFMKALRFQNPFNVRLGLRFSF